MPLRSAVCLWARALRRSARRFGDGSAYSAPGLGPSNENGVQAPRGICDPLGFAKDGDKATVNRRQSMDLKHPSMKLVHRPLHRPRGEKFFPLGDDATDGAPASCSGASSPCFGAG